MLRLRLSIAAYLLLLGAAPADLVNAAVLTAPIAIAAEACVSLEDADFSGVIDAPTQVTRAVAVAGTDLLPAHCEVHGYVNPTVGFLLRLPLERWNGRFLQIGCGGYCGAVRMLNSEYVGPLHRGYAVAQFDGGHTQGEKSALWAYNNLQAQFDFGVRAPHVVALASKAIVERLYRQPPRKSYFSGCSSGGQQALSQAQRFPWDFDGLIVGAPSPTFSGPMLYYLWAGRALAGVVDKDDLKLVHDDVMARCDLDDGIRDGVISDPFHCAPKLDHLACATRGQSRCLTKTKIEAIEKVYSGPTTSDGTKIYTGGPLPGSELNWVTDKRCCAYVNEDGKVAQWSGDYFKYVGFMPAPGPGWNADDFDFDRDYQRLRLTESVFGAADNPDLRKLKASGAKMFIYQGLADESDIPSDAVDYYETAERLLGGREATQGFFRLFLVPGMNHCTYGSGAFAIDYLKYMEDWVENGASPDVMIGAHIDESAWNPPFLFPLPQSIPVRFTRPIYPYPLRARYRGRGDPNDANSFEPVASPAFR